MAFLFLKFLTFRADDLVLIEHQVICKYGKTAKIFSLKKTRDEPFRNSRLNYLPIEKYKYGTKLVMCKNTPKQIEDIPEVKL